MLTVHTLESDHVVVELDPFDTLGSALELHVECVRGRTVAYWLTEQDAWVHHAPVGVS